MQIDAMYYKITIIQCAIYGDMLIILKMYIWEIMCFLNNIMLVSHCIPLKAGIF